MPEDMPEDTPEYMPEDMPEVMPEDMPEDSPTSEMTKNRQKSDNSIYTCKVLYRKPYGTSLALTCRRIRFLNSNDASGFWGGERLKLC